MGDPGLLEELPDIAALLPQGCGDREQAAANMVYNLLCSFNFAGRQQGCLGKNSDGVFMTQNIMGDFEQ